VRLVDHALPVLTGWYEAHGSHSARTLTANRTLSSHCGGCRVCAAGTRGCVGIR
jgi:hypothetical protein